MSARAVDKLLAAVVHGREVNPEDVLPLTRTGSAADVGPLRELAARACAKETSGRIPMSTWFEAVATFCESGPAGCVEAVRRDTRLVPFYSAVLAEAGTLESALQLLQLARLVEHHPAGERETISALNEILSFAIGPVAEPAAGEFRQYLHAVIQRTEEETLLATACLALRCVGDERSIELLRFVPEFLEPWTGTRRVVVREIRKRLRALASASHHQ